MEGLVDGQECCPFVGLETHCVTVILSEFIVPKETSRSLNTLLCRKPHPMGLLPRISDQTQLVFLQL